MAQKHVTFTVTRTDEYMFPVDENGRTLNGWTIEELQQRWFKDFPLDAFHVSRDPHRVGGSALLVAIGPVGEKS